jgi:hypothetical protein
MVRGSPAVEQYLLSTAPVDLLPATVLDHVRARIAEPLEGRPVFAEAMPGVYMRARVRACVCVCMYVCVWYFSAGEHLTPPAWR